MDWQLNGRKLWEVSAVITKFLSLEEAFSLVSSFPFAWIQELSRMTLGKNPGLPMQEEILEARYFDSSRELRLFPGEGGLQACLLITEDADHCLTEVHNIENTGLFGSSLTLGRVLDFDEDGQAYVKATRLMDWKGGTNDG